MLQQIETIKAAARANARMVAHDAATYSQAVALKAAETVSDVKAPTRTLFNAGLKFNQIAYGAAEGLIKTQRDALLGAVDGGVTRLRQAADARSLKNLWEGQVALFPVDMVRMKADLERAVGVVQDLGKRVKTLAVETREALTGGPAKQATAAASKVKASAKAATATAKRKVSRKKVVAKA